jgi:hypothetical protein
MLKLVLTAAMALSPLPQEPNVPEQAEIEAAVTRLREAFKGGDAAERVRAIEAATAVLDGTVIAWIGKGLRDSEPTVVTAAVESLRFMDHPDALECLHGLYKRDKKLRKNEEMLVRLLKAIGQHGSRLSIPILNDSPFSSPYAKVVQARILGLANIRDKDSLEALMGLMRLAGRNQIQNHMRSFRLALMVLTGTDEGRSQDAWVSWWNDNKRALVVDPKPPALPKELQRLWDAYWGNPMKRARGTKRGDRGNDPEGNGGR